MFVKKDFCGSVENDLSMCKLAHSDTEIRPATFESPHIPQKQDSFWELLLYALDNQTPLHHPINRGMA